VKLFRFCVLLALTLALSLSSSGRLSAQSPQNVTATDIERLQDALLDAGRDLSTARARDAALASKLESELEQLSDDTAYLRVKLRKNEPVPRAEYFDLRDRIDDIRSRARGGASSTAAPPRSTSSSGSSTSGSSSRGDVPVGTEFDVRLGSTLSSDTATVEQRFEATTMVDLREGDRVLVPAGSTMRGVISSVTKAGRLERKGSLTLAFDQITVRGKDRPIRATVTQALESEGVRGEAAKIGTGAGVGAIIGGILGGFKGAIAGILIGGGGTIAATEGKDVELPVGTVLRVRLDAPLDIR
jgi:hypothetical protein